MSADVRLVPVTRTDLPVLQNLAKLYTYDMSRVLGHLPGWAPGADGFIPCFSFEPYVSTQGIDPYFVRVGDEIAGFAVVQRLKSEDPWSMEQFFVMTRHQRGGVGTQVAKALWRRYPGPWFIEVIPENSPGLAFWRRSIGQVTGGTYREAIEPCVDDGAIIECVVFRFTVAA